MNVVRFGCWVLFLACVAAAQTNRVYDPDPGHIWNRVHQVLHSRTVGGRSYGSDEPDPLLWPETEHLLTGDSHRQALAVLDEFLSRHGERMITDPLRRAVFQHDLWAVFDWSDNPNPRGEHPIERRALQERLAQLILRVALNRAEIERLPDNLAQAAAGNELPNIPKDLFQVDSPWVCLCRRGGTPTAARHTSEFSGRSFFLPFLRLPGGRERTLAYLRSLREYAEPWLLERDLSDASPRIVTNPALPQFPPGTRVALVRRMMLIDQNGEVVATRLTESVQIRDYRALPASTAGQSDVSEFRLSRKALFSHQAGGLTAIGPEDKEFPVFMTHGIDPFEMSHQFGELERHQATVLNTCASCHRGSGIHSVLSYTQSFGTFEGRLPEIIGCQSTDDQAKLTVIWEQHEHNLGLLQGLWLH
jgi:hypothetical protein